MNYLKYTAMALLLVSAAGFIWLAWFLASTPASAFDTQGPGLLGAFVMFAAQITGLAGLLLFLVWLAIKRYRRTREAG